MMFQDFLLKEIWQNRMMDYLMALGVFIIAAIVIRIIESFMLRKLKAFAEKTKTTIDDFLTEIVKSTVVPLVYFGVFYMSINILKVSDKIAKFINVIGVAVLTIFVTRLAGLIVSYGFQQYWKKKGKDAQLEGSLRGILKVLKIMIWGMAIVFFLDNLGFEISAVIAGLGVGGVAVALAAQAVLGDLFSYFAILFDRPFEIGDFIIVGDYLGVVERVGIKTTRICSLGGEQIIFSNTDLTNSRVRNYKRMQKRRVLFQLGVIYSTPLEKLEEIPEIIENVIKEIDDTIFDRAHFFKYGDFSLIYEIVYYVMGADYNKYMDIQQKINFAINKEFAKRQIEFAYPTQTLYVSKTS